MRVAIITESRFEQTHDGRVWSRTLLPAFWDRYLSVFDEVKVIARIQRVEVPVANSRPVNTERTTFSPIPYYQGPAEFAKNALVLEKALKSAVSPVDAVIMRIGSMLAARVEPVLTSRGQPYGVEVVGDPYDVFARGAVSHPLRPFLRWYFARQVRSFCARAAAVGYVTATALQRRYPPNPKAFTTHYSSIDLDSESFRQRSAESLVPSDGPFRVLMVGSLEQLYKAPDVLLDAIALCRSRGLDIELTLVGDGRFKSQLEQQAQSLGIADRVTFTGMLPAGDAIREQLDTAHLFVLPSRTEGLPRAMIEAMARSLPCIGANVGGIPELLPEEALVLAGDAAGLAARIALAVSDPEWRIRMSARNFEKAQEYRRDVLEERRTALYRSLRERTEEWQQGRS